MIGEVSVREDGVWLTEFRVDELHHVVEVLLAAVASVRDIICRNGT